MGQVNKVITVKGQDARELNQLLNVIAEYKELEKKAKLAISKVKELYPEPALLETNKYTVVLSLNKGKTTIDSSIVKELYPDIYSKCLKVGKDTLSLQAPIKK